MRKIFFVLSMLITASFVFTACDPAANTTANRPANAVNNANTAPVSTAAVEADIKKMVNDVAAALAKNDADALDRIYGDNYMLVGLDGSLQNKAERLASIRSGDTKFESFVYDEVNVRTNPEATGAVVIARATRKGMNKGQRVDGQIRSTQVWSKTNDGWKLVSAHSSPITGSATTTSTNTATANRSANTSANMGSNRTANMAANSAMNSNRNSNSNR